MNVRRKLSVLALCCLSQLGFGIILNNPDYQVETYITYDTENIGYTRDFTFDSAGNIYAVHTFENHTRTGSVQKIDTSKVISTLRSDLVDPRYITWGGGTAFGDNLYISDRQETSHYSTGEVTKIDLLGNKSLFSGGYNQPGMLNIDQTGNYNNRLYTANSAHAKILRVGASGGTATVFSSYPGDSIAGAIHGMAFDTTGNYGGNMFVGTRAGKLSVAGLFLIDPSGNESRYTDFEQASAVAFDDTDDQAFGGKMFVAGRDDADTLWTLYQVNGFYDAEVFGSFEVTPGWTRPDIEFGPDGAMYILEYDAVNKDVIISRITRKTIAVSMDIKPQSCPNPVNIKSKGVLPVAILGSDVFDVDDIDIASLEILGVKPIRSSYEDVSAPADITFETDCMCTTDGPDGYVDLTLKFNKQEIVEAIGQVKDGDEVVLKLTGVLTDGTPIEGTDCVWILKKGKDK